MVFMILVFGSRRHDVALRMKQNTGKAPNSSQGSTGDSAIQPHIVKLHAVWRRCVDCCYQLPPT